MAEAESSKELTKPSELFKATNVWTVHLRFTPDQWEAMEPKQNGRGFLGGPGGGRGPGAGGFGPAMVLAPAFLKEGDQNKDGRLSKEEFRALSEKWFEQWDKEKAGKLNADQVRAGVNAMLGQSNIGPPGTGGPGGRGGGMLQGQEGKRNGLSSAAGIEFNYVLSKVELFRRRRNTFTRCHKSCFTSC